MIYPNNFESKLGFDKIRQSLITLCLSDLGREKVNNISLITNINVLNNTLDQVEDFRQICLEEDDFPVSNYIDTRQILTKGQVEGTFFTLRELFDIKKSLETIKALVNFFKNCDPEKYTSLRELAQNITIYPFIFDTINRVMTQHGKMKDNASPELNEIRNSIRQKQNSVSRKMDTILRGAISAGLVEPDTQISIREGRAVIPIGATNKRKISGIIHDQSATGKTAYVEPAEIVEINNDIKELTYAEQREIVRILIAITSELRPYIPDLFDQYDFLGQIDFVRSKALYAIKTDSIRIPITQEPNINWIDARHPILDLLLRGHKQKIVAQNINMSKDKRIILISGPNAGGKSVCLQTVGLVQFMIQNGLLAPVAEGSSSGIFDGIFVDMGDEQSIENDLSTYSSHLLNMKYFLKNCNSRTLILIDEFGTGTEPLIGGAIAQSILENLRTKETFGVITTHYTNLKHYASSVEGIINGAMMFDTGKIEPLFKLQVGQPGSSFAFEIARKIGLPEEILTAASDQVGEEHINFDKNLRQIVRDKFYWQQKRDKIRQSDKKLDKLIGEYSEELQDVKKLRKEIVQQAKDEAKQLLAEANKQIENTIRKIREEQAEKEKTKQIRKELENFKKTVNDDLEDDDTSKLDNKLEKIRRREERKKNRENQPEQPKEETKKETLVLEKGAKVRLIGQASVGEVMDITPKSVMVSFGSLITTVNKKKLELISNNEYKRQTRGERRTASISYSESISERKLNFKPHLDVRGMRADDALQKVSDFIDNAIMVDMSEVTILHGKGNGILRQLIREFLGGVDLIKSYNDERIELGGAGITVVKFDR